MTNPQTYSRASSNQLPVVGQLLWSLETYSYEAAANLSIKLQRLNNFEKYLWKYQVFRSTTTNSVSTASFRPYFLFPLFIHFFPCSTSLHFSLSLPIFPFIWLSFIVHHFLPSLSSFHHALPSLHSLHTSTFVSFVFFLFLVLLISQYPFPFFPSLNLPLILYLPFIPAFFTFHFIPSLTFYPSFCSLPILCFSKNFSFGLIYVGL